MRICVQESIRRMHLASIAPKFKIASTRAMIINFKDLFQFVSYFKLLQLNFNRIIISNKINVKKKKKKEEKKTNNSNTTKNHTMVNIKGSKDEDDEPVCTTGPC